MLVQIEHPDLFKEGTRVIMRTLRGKEGGSNKPDRKSKKYVTRSVDEFNETHTKLLAERQENERIYSTINPRNIEKAIRIFKERMLDSDYYADEDRHWFYIDMYNRWISSLMAPTAKMDTQFLVDIDYDEGDNVNYEGVIREEIKKFELTIIHEYETKNGRHIILKPFNRTLVSFETRVDAMMLWAYEK